MASANCMVYKPRKRRHFFGNGIGNLKEKKGIKFDDFIESEKCLINGSQHKRMPRKEGPLDVL